jgi:hypothetical protein
MNRTLTVARRLRWGIGFLAGLGLSALVLAIGPPLPAPAESASLVESGTAGGLPSDLRREGWRLLKVPGKAQAEFTKQGLGAIAISADKAVAFLYRPLDPAMGPKRRLAWSWRVDRAAPPTDLARAPGDDRSLAVHLVFPVDAERLFLLERMELALTRLVAPPLAGRVLTYVWGGDHPEGSVLINPHLDRQGRIIVLRSGFATLGNWKTEGIDFADDFRKVYGSSAPAPAFLAISADSDDTASRIFGAVADLTFGG